MRLEVAERMRCPRPHVPTPLIVVAHRTIDRELVEGVAGCPVCHLEAQVVDGLVWFPSADARPVAAATSATSATTSATTTAVERLVALLGLAEPGGTVLLTGRYAALAPALTRLADVDALLLNAAAAGASSVIVAESVVPFTDGTFRAAALDAEVSLPVALDAVRTVAEGGRIVGALPLERPSTVRELARDAEEWVGERELGAGPPIPLRRA